MWSLDTGPQLCIICKCPPPNFEGYFFSRLTVCFTVQKLLHVLKFHMLLVSPGWPESYSESCHPSKYPGAHSLLFPLEVSTLSLRFLIHLWVGKEKERSTLILLHATIKFPQHRSLLRPWLLFNVYFGDPCQKSAVWNASVLSHWSVCLFLCQCRAICITMALQYNLKSGMVIPPAETGP